MKKIPISKILKKGAKLKARKLDENNVEVIALIEKTNKAIQQIPTPIRYK